VTKGMKRYLGGADRRYQELQEARKRIGELEAALEDCLELLNAIDMQVTPERMKQFRVDPYGTISDARRLLRPQGKENTNGR